MKFYCFFVGNPNRESRHPYWILIGFFQICKNLFSIGLDRPQRFESKSNFFSITYLIFKKNRTSSLETTNNSTWTEGRWTGGGNHVLSGGYRVFLPGDRQTKCLGGDRQRTVWCLDQHERRYPEFVTDEQNTLSLCPVEDETKLVAVRIKHEVLYRVRQCEPWSTSHVTTLKSWSSWVRVTEELLSPLLFTLTCLSVQKIFLFPIFNRPKPKIETHFFVMFSTRRADQIIQ